MLLLCHCASACHRLASSLPHHGMYNLPVLILQRLTRAVHAALAVVHYKLGELEQSQDLYARAYDIQVRQANFAPSLAIFCPSGVIACRMPV